MENPFSITVYDKSGTRIGWLDAPISQTWHLRHNQQSNGEIVVQHGSHQDTLLSGPGKRVSVAYKGDVILTGPARARRAEGAGPKRQARYQIQDDFRILGNVLLWANPYQPIWNQRGGVNGTGTHYRRSGPAETVLKNGIADNHGGRLGVTFSSLSSGGKGATISYRARFVTITEELLALADKAGVGIRVRRNTNSSGRPLLVTVYEGKTWPIPLSEESGTLLSASWELEGPTCTRVVIGGAFADHEREFFDLVNPVIEDEWGDVIEKFVDAGSISGDYVKAFNDHALAVEKLRETQASRATAARDLSFKERALRIANAVRLRYLASYQDHPDIPKVVEVYNEAVSRYNTALAERDAALTTLANTGGSTTTAAQAEQAARTALYAAYESYREDILELATTELAKGVATSGFSLNLAEGEVFRYGGTDGFQVGDKVTIEVTPGKFVTDVLRQATLSLSSSGGFTVTPVVGERSGDPMSKIAKLVGSAISGPNKVRTR